MPAPNITSQHPTTTQHGTCHTILICNTGDAVNDVCAWRWNMLGLNYMEHFERCNGDKTETVKLRQQRLRLSNFQLPNSHFSIARPHAKLEHDVAVAFFVCLSICIFVSVFLKHFGIMPKWLNISWKFLTANILLFSELNAITNFLKWVLVHVRYKYFEEIHVLNFCGLASGHTWGTML